MLKVLVLSFSLFAVTIAHANDDPYTTPNTAGASTFATPQRDEASPEFVSNRGQALGLVELQCLEREVRRRIERLGSDPGGQTSASFIFHCISDK